MEVGDKVEPFNPWMVESIDQFLNYCCPECDTKQKTKSGFMIHAIDAHPNSRQFLPLFDYEEGKDQENVDIFDDELSDIEVKEDYVPSFESLKTEFRSGNNSPSVKLEPLSINILLNMECDNCGRFFVTQDSMLDHKVNCGKDVNKAHKRRKDVKLKPTKKVKLENKTSEVEPEKQSKEIRTMKSKAKSKYLLDIDPKDGIQKFKCKECEIFFKSSSAMRKHKETLHSNSEELEKCFICPDVIPTKMVSKHMRGKHLSDDGDFKCDLCSKYSSSGYEFFLYHLTKEHQIGEFRHKCDHCGKAFGTSSSLKTHTITHQDNQATNQSLEVMLLKSKDKSKYLFDTDPKDGIQKYKCKECGMFFKSSAGMRHHKKRFHSNLENMQKCFICPDIVPFKMIPAHMIGKHRNEDGTFKCDLCSNVFSHKQGCEHFLYHLTKEHQIGEFRHRCDQCDKAFKIVSDLNSHKKISHEKSCVVICDQCGKECQSKITLENHLRLVHHMYKISKEETIQNCDKCDIEFEKPEEFNDHLKGCLDEQKDFKCKLCDSSWVSHLSLWQHIAVDHKILRHICDMCGHASPTPKNLIDHKNHVHYKVYDFVCHICAQPKRNKTTLDEHMIIAHGQGERKFKCDRCDKSFVRSLMLRKHIESHHERKTLYQCEQCPKTFWMKDYLKTHVRMMHDKIRPHKCDICQQGFVYKRDVVSHKKHVHNIHE